MKAERRHELKTNTLAQGLGGLPAFWAVHGTKVLLGVVAVLAIVLFIRFQANSARQQQAMSEEALGNAHMAIDSLRGLAGIRDPKLAAEQRRQIQEQADTALRQVLDDSKDETLRASALLAQGDLHWELSRTAGAGAGAQTQPAGKDRESRDELLDKAKRAYESAAQAPGAKPVTINSAYLGLATIAEEQGKWDEAGAAYDKIQTHPALPPAFKLDAQERKESLAKIRNPALIGKPPTRPATDEPAGPMGPAAPTTTGATTRTSTTSPAATQIAPATTQAGSLPVEK
jgi:tetratricopeptide (TPR) repeat protein